MAEVYDRLMAPVPYAAWVDYAASLWRRAGVAPVRILDLACGTGNVTRELLRRGYTVAGVDASPGMLRVARRKLPAAVALYQQDMREFSLPEAPFDVCVCLFDSLNYLLHADDLRRTFRQVARHLRPGGVFVCDMNAIYALETGMFNQHGRGEGGLEYEWHSAWDAVGRLCTIHMFFRERDGDGRCLLEETHVQRGYAMAEALESFEAAGFARAEVFHAFTFDPPRARTDRYHFLARMPPA